MSDFPPPNVEPGAGAADQPPHPEPPLSRYGITPSAPPPPGGFQPTTPVVGPPPAQHNGPKRGVIIAAVVVVAALIVGGILLVTRGDDDDASTSDTTEVTDAADTTDATETTAASTEPTEATTTPTEATTPDTPETTDPPETTAQPTTTTGEPTTTAAPPTTVFAQPAGSIDLGHRIYLPVPDGWSQVNEPGAPVVISNEATQLSVQSLARDPGEDVATLVQEYADTFAPSFGGVSFGPTMFNETIAGPMPANTYITRYTTYDPGDATGLSGIIGAYVRADGLSVVLDVFSSVNTLDVPPDAIDVVRTSLVNAPSQGPSVELTQHEPFRVSSITPFLEVQGPVGFSVAPGFTAVTTGSLDSPFALASNGGEDFSALKVGGQADVNTVIATAQSYLQQSYADVAYNAPTADEADGYGVLHGAFTWSGTYVDGTPSAGRIDYYLDPVTSNAVVSYRSWFTTLGPDEPAFAEAEFMQRSLYDSISTIP